MLRALSKAGSLSGPMATGSTLLFACLLVASCGTQPEALSPLTSGHYVRWSGSGVSFTYPQRWSRVHGSPSSFTDMVAAVSNHDLTDPCFTSGDTSSCGQPLASLQAATLLVEWWEDGYPGWSLGSQPGRTTTVDGLPGKIRQGGPATVGSGICYRLGADRWITVVIGRPTTTDNYFQFVVCMKGPGLALERSAAMRILQTAHLARG